MRGLEVKKHYKHHFYDRGKDRDRRKDRESSLVFQTAMSYIGAIVGAGFASGQELLAFFAIYGKHGFYGVILSAVLLGILPLGVAHLFCRTPVSGQAVPAPALSFRIYRYYVTAYLFGGLCVMLSGSRMVFGTYLGLSPETGGVIMAVALALTVLGRTEAFLKVNGILVPFLVLLTAYVCLVSLTRSTVEQLAVPTLADASGSGQWTFLPGSWVASSLLYVSYNLPLGATVLAAVGGPRLRLIRGTAIGAVCLAILMLLFVAAALKQSPDIAAEESPMLRMADDRGALLGSMYAGILWIAMFTTALAETLGLVNDLVTRSRLGYAGATLLVLGAAYPMSRYSFAKMVSSVYPILGYLGLPLTVLVAVHTLLSFLPGTRFLRHAKLF
ncbi:MAG TPA: hypothetical protein GX507_04010 [Clostridia bacterium]|nr:hypothetical protein [Clostridia bacterium]